MTDEQLAIIMNALNLAIVSLSQSDNIPPTVIKSVIDGLKPARQILIDEKFPLGYVPPNTGKDKP